MLFHRFCEPRAAVKFRIQSSTISQFHKSFGDFGSPSRASKLHKERQLAQTEESLQQAFESKLYDVSPTAGTTSLFGSSCAPLIAGM